MLRLAFKSAFKLKPQLPQRKPALKSPYDRFIFGADLRENDLLRGSLGMSSNREESDFIPSVLYDQIMKWVPIPSVEAVIVIEGSLLFLRRKNKPAVGQWWFAGGRIHMGESLEETLHREVKEETGLQISAYKFINVYSRVFPDRHDISIKV